VQFTASTCYKHPVSRTLCFHTTASPRLCVFQLWIYVISASSVIQKLHMLAALPHLTQSRLSNRIYAWLTSNHNRICVMHLRALSSGQGVTKFDHKLQHNSTSPQVALPVASRGGPASTSNRCSSLPERWARMRSRALVSSPGDARGKQQQQQQQQQPILSTVMQGLR